MTLEVSSKRIEMAMEDFNGGLICSQTVLAAFAGELRLPREMAIKIASPFGGGVARTGRMCGAVTGAIMVLGLAFGNEDREDKESRERTYQLVQRFIDDFIAAHGTVECKGLLGFDIADPEQHQRAAEAGTFFKVCPAFVTTAIMLVEKTLEQSG